MIATMLKRRRRLTGKQQVMEKVARMFSGELGSKEAIEIERWRQRHPEYEQDFLDALHGLADLGVLAGRQEHLAIEGTSRSAQEVPKAYSKRWPAFGVAATVLIMTLVAFNSVLHRDEEAPGTTLMRYVTRVGEQKSVTLVDGSVITMNTGSEILVNIDDNRRRVSLERGEVLFDVSKDAERPFTVNVDSRAITVLGTEFNIFKTPENFTLAVLDGVVAVHEKQEQALSSSPELVPNDKSQTVIESPGQRLVRAGTVATYDIYKNRVAVSRPDHISRLVTWQNGLLRYDGQPLSKVVQDFNRYSGKKILIENAAVMNLEVYATFRVDRLNMALSDLEKTHPIKVIQYFDRVVISEK